MKKRILSMFLAIVMTVGMLSAVPVYAAEDCDHVDGDDTDHWCDICQDPMEDLCTDADGNHFCDVCTGHAYRFCTEEAGIWDGGTWDKINHLVICSVCSWSRWESHTDETDDGYCDVCGAYTGCMHANDSLTMRYAEVGHQAWCSVCENVVKQEPHDLTYISDNDGHLPDCSNCDYPFDKVSHVHDSKNWTGRNNAGHYVECDVCEYAVWQDHTERGTCGICGLDVTYFYEVYVGGKGLLNGQYLDNAGNITTTRPDGGYARYADGVLELNNYVYEGYGSLWMEEPGEYQYYTAVASFVPMKLELTGTNALTTIVDEIDIPGVDGILPPLSYLANGASGIAAARGGLTIGGSGSLEISTPDMGIAADSDLTIESCEITIDTGSEGLDLFNCDLKIEGGTITITSEESDGIDLRNSSLTMWDGIFTVTAKDNDGIDMWDSSLELLGGTVHITAEDYGINGYEGGTVDISGGYLDIQTDDVAVEAMRITVAENMMPEGCEIKEVEYDTFCIVDQEGIPLTGVTFALPQITGVTVTVDGVPYTEGRVVITPETESVVYTVSGIKISKHGNENLIAYADGFTLSTADPGFVVDAASNTAAWTVPDDRMEELKGSVGFEVAYSNGGNDPGAYIGTGIYLYYCAVHTPDSEIGQTCQGYFCTVCESWYGEKNDNHTFDDDGICEDCGEEKTEYNGLVVVDGQWRYYEGGIFQKKYTGLVPYGDILFYVENGILDFTYTGLVWYNDAWTYVANSQLTEGYTGLVWFEGEWFYTVDSIIDWTFTGLVPYEGNMFYVQNNHLDWTYTGLAYLNDGWYYVENALLKPDYTGLTYFNDNWFYVVDGTIDWTFTGMVPYEGNYFYVQNNLLDWSYTGLGYHDNAWYYFRNALYNTEFEGLVPFNGALFYVKDGTVDWAYNGTAEYDGVTYTVVDGAVVL